MKLDARTRASIERGRAELNAKVSALRAPKTVAGVLYPHLPSDAGTRPPVNQSDAWRGATSPLGGQAVKGN
jgi:hypothetical protein